MTIPVYVIASGQSNSSYVAKLTSLFDNPLFDLNVVKVEEDCSKCEGERKAFKHALKSAQENFCDDPCIIVKDCMFSNLSSSDMCQLINRILSSNVSWDLCYLARYLDRCDGSVVICDLTVGGSLVTTQSAEGDDAIMYSTHARDVILKALTPPCAEDDRDCWDKIQKKKTKGDNNHHHKKKHNQCPADLIHHDLSCGNLNGVAVSPPVLQYNPVFGEFTKTWECSHGDHPKPPCPDNNTSTSYAWIPLVILFIIIIVLLIWFVWFRR